jgi:predicted RNA binding protein YcfA (HicA-like mRNA interferase family)
MKSLDNPRDMAKYAKSQGLEPVGCNGGHGYYGNKNGKVAIPVHGVISKDLQHRIIKQILALLAVVVAIWLWNDCPPALYTVWQLVTGGAL